MSKTKGGERMYEICSSADGEFELRDQSRRLEDAIELAEQFVSTVGGRIVVIDPEIDRVVWESETVIPGDKRVQD